LAAIAHVRVRDIHEQVLLLVAAQPHLTDQVHKLIDPTQPCLDRRYRLISGDEGAPHFEGEAACAVFTGAPRYPQ
jgi:hypothetical protein